MTDQKQQTLRALCDRNGRTYDQASDGTTYTMDREGTDGHFFPDIDAAIAWERGYKEAGQTAWTIEGSYDNGRTWDPEVVEETEEEARQRLKEYRDNVDAYGRGRTRLRKVSA